MGLVITVPQYINEINKMYFVLMDNLDTAYFSFISMLDILTKRDERLFNKLNEQGFEGLKVFADVIDLESAETIDNIKKMNFFDDEQYDGFDLIRDFKNHWREYLTHHRSGLVS